ncbi:hypothetical protein [Streptomyces lonarensis]|uniref:Uncharacterized protein n=1 Tax=Streptomyces lonarensis TaxID=700599 RepID=A0A7X6CZ32_9ACTN|nr:hypothetical protein [Streptomyces lonarensis]NJQ05211.1 hypothetical protein [Streptomyces lonarensis]
MNYRSLNRGDGGVIAAAVLLFVFSFLKFFSTRGLSSNGWSTDWFPALPSIFLAGIIGAALVVVGRIAKPEIAGREFLGLRLSQWGTALTVTALWASLWTLIGGKDGLDTAAGQILSFFAVLILVGFVVATPLVPALQAPLIPEKSATPAQPQQPGQQQPQPGAYGQHPQPGYGYPGPQAGGPQPGYAAPTQHMQQQPPQQPQPAAPAAPDPNFQPFWFAVPVQRPLYAEDGSQNTVAELTPGTWYLAVGQSGQELVAQTQDGRRGVLKDTSNIQRG